MPTASHGNFMLSLLSGDISRLRASQSPTSLIPALQNQVPSPTLQTCGEASPFPSASLIQLWLFHLQMLHLHWRETHSSNGISSRMTPHTSLIILSMKNRSEERRVGK